MPIKFLNTVAVDTSVLYVDTINDRVGIGTTSPSRQLELRGQGVIRLNSTSSDPGLDFNTSDVNDMQIRYRSITDALAIYSYGTSSDVLTIKKSDGNVGIGTTSPFTNLTVYGATDSRIALINSNSGTTSSDGFVMILENDSEVNFLNRESAAIKFSTAATEKMRITSAGNVGIGTTSPSKKLHVNSGTTNEVARFESTDSAAYLSIMDNTTTNSLQGIGSAGNDLTFYSNNAERMRIDSSGNVGIGTTSPGEKLEVVGTARSTYNSSNYSQLESNASGGVFKANASGSTNILLRSYGHSHFSGGNVGIGTTSPAEKLDVVGNIKLTENVKVSANKGFVNSGAWTRNATPYGNIEFGPANTTHAHIYTDRPNFYFNKELYVNNNRVYNTGYHPEADKWTTARTLTLTGFVTGSVSWDGSANASITTSGGSYTPLNDIRSLGTPAFTNGTNPNITTAQVMDEIDSDGGFDSYSSVFKTSWSYAGNYNLTDAGRFTETAGSSWITWTDNSSDSTRGNVTALAIAPTTGGSAGKVFIYNNQGSSYSPGWREVWTNTSDGAGSGLDADLLDGQQGSYYATASSLGNYLPLSAGSTFPLTGALYLENSNTDVVMSGNTSGNFTIDNNTGNIAFLANGSSVQSMTITSSLITINEPTNFTNGNVGIGTTSPGYKLDVYADSTAGVASVKNAANGRDTFRSENASGTRTFNVGNDSSGHGILLVRNSSGTTTNYIAGSGNSYFNAGNVGIGTTSPSQKLHVSGSARVTGAYYDSNNSPGTSGQVLSSTVTGTDWVDAGGGGGGIAGTIATNQVAYGTATDTIGGHSGLTYDGFGTLRATQIQCTSAIFVASNIYHYSDTNTSINFSVDQIDLYAGGLKMITCDESTNDEVIINENSADINFRVESNAYTHMFFVDGGLNRVGINQSVPSYTLDVNGDAKISGTIVDSTNSAGSNNDVLTSTGSGWSWQPAGGGGGGIGGSIANTQVAFGNASSEITGDVDFNFNVSTNTLRIGVDNDYSGGIVAMAMTADQTTTLDITLGSSNGSTPSYITQNRNPFNGQTKFGFAGSDTIAFNTSASERLRITSTGNVGIGTTSPSALLDIATANTSSTLLEIDMPGTSQFGCGIRVKSSGISSPIAEFTKGISTAGSITYTSGMSTGVSYNTSSDYRLKENVIAITDGIERIKQLKPSKFNFIGSEQNVDGFIAHEVQDVIPEAIHGEKDAVDNEGNDIYQGIDQSKVVPLLTAALQEAIEKIETLETRVQTLENKQQQNK